MRPLRLARHELSQDANGPGMRLVLWVQGCSIRCAGCINPWSWRPDAVQVDFGAGKHPVLDALWSHLRDLILSASELGASGLTLTGGEPFDQDPEAIREICHFAQHHLGSVGVFTGYTPTQLLSDTIGARHRLAFQHIDWLVAGPYRRDLPRGKGILSSSNQQLVLLTDRHRNDEFHACAELTFDLDAANVFGTGTILKDTK